MMIEFSSAGTLVLGGVECHLIRQVSNVRSAISIIIRTKNEEEKLGEVLRSIYAQSCERPFEVILIDSGSTDKTIEIAKRYPVNIIAIKPEDFSFGTSCNIGIEAATGEYCIFLSGHAIPVGVTWLEELVQPLVESSDVVGSYARQIYSEDAWVLERKSIDAAFGNEDRRQSFDSYVREKGHVPHKFQNYSKLITFSNACSCVRRETALAQPFADLPASEDREWAYRCLLLGKTVSYVSRALVVHYHNESPKDWYRRIYLNSKAIKEFAQVALPLWAIPPVVIYRLFTDLMYCLRNSCITELRPLRLFHYECLYALAHYRGGKDC